MSALKIKKVHEVFGNSPDILHDTYVDRGNLDAELRKWLGRKNHIALKAPSKSGKTWLRKKVLNNPITVQCRIGKSVDDIYTEALAALDIELRVTRSSSNSFTGELRASGDAGLKLLSKVSAELSGSLHHSTETEFQELRRQVSNLDFIAETINASGRRLVIEDFHYLPSVERQQFAYDLKTLWEHGLFVVVIGIWEDTNYLLSLNGELSSRVKELSIHWSKEELSEILQRGGAALNISFDTEVVNFLADVSYGSAGILQRLTLGILDEVGIEQTCKSTTKITGIDNCERATASYVEEIGSIYQEFARKTSQGMRARKNSTGIYAHTMKALLEAHDHELLEGIPAKRLYQITHAIEPRIQLPNLRSALGKLDELQSDDGGRGMVVQFADDKVTVVDHQLLLYRRFTNKPWPWEEIIEEVECESGNPDSGDQFEGA